MRQQIVAGVAEEAGERSIAELEAERDRLLLAILRAKAEARDALGPAGASTDP